LQTSFTTEHGGQLRPPLPVERHLATREVVHCAAITPETSFGIGREVQNSKGLDRLDVIASMSLNEPQTPKQYLDPRAATRLKLDGEQNLAIRAADLTVESSP
jgi:hypothetical protein